MKGNLAILQKVMENYELSTLSIKHYFREVYYVETDKGPKALKLCDRDEKKTNFIFNIMQHVWDKDFHKLSRPIATKEGKSCVIENEDVFFLADWVHGEKCDFRDIENLLSATQTLAEFHNVSFGYYDAHQIQVRCMADKWRLTFTERLKDLKSFYRQARLSQTPFANQYLQHYEYHIGLAERANLLLAKSNYYKIAREAVSKGFFTHRDIAGRNFIMVGKEAHLIDFDYARYDIRITDLVRMLERGLRLHDWSCEVGKQIIETYNTFAHNKLTKDEYVIIHAFLILPQKFWRLCSRYFKSKRSWEEESFLRKLNSLMKKELNSQQFMDWFEEEYCY